MEALLWIGLSFSLVMGTYIFLERRQDQRLKAQEDREREQEEQERRLMRAHEASMRIIEMTTTVNDMPAFKYLFSFEPDPKDFKKFIGPALKDAMSAENLT